MALPDNTLSTITRLADYYSPYDRFTDDLTDFEAGGSAIGVSQDGLDFQIWALTYVDDEEAVNYGDLVITGETTGETKASINVPDVKACALAWDQNMREFIAYELGDCSAKFYWYDTFIAGFTTTTLPAGSYSLQCCLDDHRLTQTGTSDIILAYLRNGTLYYREQRDRYAVEYALKSNLGGAKLSKVGMTDNFRLKFEILEGRGVRLSHIVGDINELCGLPASRFNVDQLYPTYVRGFMAAGKFTGADAIRRLQTPYFFDFPEVDGKLLAVNRGGEIAAQITIDDMIVGEEADLETAREQGVEFPKKLHLSYKSTETEYAPTKATSERRSPLIKSLSEETVETSVNFSPQEAAERSDILHKVSWNELEGRADFMVSEKFAYLVPSDVISVEVKSGNYKRMRIEQSSFVDGGIAIEARIDRQSAYISGSISVPTIAPAPAPAPITPGDTTFEFLDLPILDGKTDTLHYYAAGTGAKSSWNGATVQQLIGSDYETVGSLATSEIIGELLASVYPAPRDFPDKRNEVIVSLNRDPTTFTTDDLLRSKGSWLIGDEIVQIRDWAPSGNEWVGTYLLRGRLNTTPVIHEAGARVVYLAAPEQIELAVSYLGLDLDLRVYSYGQAATDGQTGTYTFSGYSQREWAPINLVANQSGNDWVFSWEPRHRLGNSATPIPSVNFYGWRLYFTVGSTVHNVTTSSTDPGYTFTEADQITYFGSAQSSFDSVEIMAMNHLGGEGESISEAVT